MSDASETGTGFLFWYGFRYQFLVHVSLALERKAPEGSIVEGTLLEILGRIEKIAVQIVVSSRELDV